MYFNKWLQLAGSVFIALLGVALQFDWSSVGFEPATAGKIIMALGVAKSITNTLAPSSSTIVNPTGGAIVSQAAPPR